MAASVLLHVASVDWQCARQSRHGAAGRRVGVER